MMAGTKKEIKELESLSDAGVDEDDISFRLTDERRKRLEEVDFVWSAREGEKGTEQGRITRNSYDDQWDQMFTRLQGYKKSYGDCLVPKRFKEDPKLGTWVDTQRVQFKKMKKKLEEHGITYEGPEDAKEAKYDDDADEGSLSSTNGTNQAQSMNAKPVVGRLTDDRIRRLENLGFVWSLRDDWQKHYLELKEYKEEHGHCNVSLCSVVPSCCAVMTLTHVHSCGLSWSLSVPALSLKRIASPLTLLDRIAIPCTRYQQDT
jgi:hypothetical protein